MNTLAIGNIPTTGNSNDICQSNTQVLAHDLVHFDGTVIAIFIRQDDADGISSFLSLDQDSVATKELKFLHFGGGKCNDGIIVVGGVVDNQAIGAALFAARVQDSVRHVFVFAVFVSMLFELGSFEERVSERE